MKVKFKDGTIIEVLDAEGVSKEEIIAEAKKIKSQMKDAAHFDQKAIDEMTAYLIREGELDEGDTLEDYFGADYEEALELVYWGTQYESQGALNMLEFKKGVLYEWCDDDIIEDIVKEYIRDNYPDDYPRSMEEFDEEFMNVAPWDLAKTIFNSEFNPNDKYFAYRGDGNLKSFNYIKDYLETYEDDAIKNAIENNKNIDCDMYNILVENENVIEMLTYFAINELGY